MPLESCMILLDNSEFMRNGDYIPTRLEAQQDAANLLVGAKTQSHPESTVGVSAGTDLLVSPTDDVGKILNALHDLAIVQKVDTDVTASVQVASLALKHRRNKNGSQRIVLFVGSPVSADPKALAKAGRQLKKNNVAIDVVCMGEVEQNEDLLKELVDAANGRGSEGEERTCHLVTIPAGVLPSDVLASSPIVHGGSGGSAFAASAAAAAASGNAGGGGGGGGDMFAEFGGVDPNMDPELAMALRVSMEEERARQERVAAQQAAAAAEESKQEESASSSAAAAGGQEGQADTEMADSAADAPAPSGDNSAAAAAAMDMGLSEEEALLQQALAMSMDENAGGTDAAAAKPEAAAPMEEDDEAAAMQMALAMSMQQDDANNDDSDDKKKQEFQDPQFVNQLLGSLPGVNPNDPAIQSALKNLEEQKKDSGKKGGDDKKKDGDKKE
jgi:26S proteasome regulatory subunit N10